MNWSKSLLFAIDSEAKGSMVPDLQLQWAVEFTYPGAQISRDVNSYIPLNLSPVVKQVRAKLKAWENIPLSLLGCVNLIKMKILPKFNYLFPNSPKWISRSFFIQLNSLFSSFLWRLHPPRFKLPTLMCPTSQGGLVLSDCHKYYIAAQLVTAD